MTPSLSRDRNNVAMRRLRILLVEDHDFTRATVAAALRVENCFVVASVGSARDAMLAAGEHEIDCAVIDMHLGSGPSGIDLAHGLRKLYSGLGIVLLTSFTDPRLLAPDQRSLPPGAVYVVKDDVHSTVELRHQIDVALGTAPRPVSRGMAAVSLTDMQAELLRLVAEGLTNAEIARRRVVSERAVETALARVATRLGIESSDGRNVRVLLVKAYVALTGEAGSS